MKRIVAGAIAIFVVIIMLAFVSAIIGNIDTTLINGTVMEPIWNTTTTYTGTTLNLMTPLVLMIGVGLLVYAVYKLAKKR